MDWRFFISPENVPGRSPRNPEIDVFWPAPLLIRKKPNPTPIERNLSTPTKTLRKNIGPHIAAQPFQETSDDDSPGRLAESLFCKTGLLKSTVSCDVAWLTKFGCKCNCLVRFLG